MKYPVGTKVRLKPQPIKEIDQAIAAAQDTEYHFKDDHDWVWFSEEEVAALFDVVEEGKSPDG